MSLTSPTCAVKSVAPLTVVGDAGITLSPSPAPGVASTGHWVTRLSIRACCLKLTRKRLPDYPVQPLTGGIDKVHPSGGNTASTTDSSQASQTASALNSQPTDVGSPSSRPTSRLLVGTGLLRDVKRPEDRYAPIKVMAAAKPGRRLVGCLRSRSRGSTCGEHSLSLNAPSSRWLTDQRRRFTTPLTRLPDFPRMPERWPTAVTSAITSSSFNAELAAMLRG
jgi:hypothetical protein